MTLRKQKSAYVSMRRVDAILNICAKQGGTAGNFIPVPATLFVAGQVFCFCPANKKFYERRQKYV